MARDREQHDLGDHRNRRQRADGAGIEPGGLPRDGRKRVDQGMARLDQARRYDNGQEHRVAQQAARANRARRARLGRSDRQQHEADDGGQTIAAGNQPDQILRRHDMQQQASPKAADDKTGRSPHTDRTIGPAVPGKAAQGISVDQRHGRCVDEREQRKDRENRNRAVHQTDQAVTKTGRGGADNDGGLQGIAAIRLTGHHRDGDDPDQHRRCQHQADHARFEAFCRKPDREKRELYAQSDEIGGVVSDSRGAKPPVHAIHERNRHFCLPPDFQGLKS